MPKGYQILSVEMQNGIICLWALVDPEQPLEVRDIRIAGTGDAIKETEIVFIGTVLLHGGSRVYHIFEVKKD
jgi:hypothetical protein